MDLWIYIIVLFFKYMDMLKLITTPKKEKNDGIKILFRLYFPGVDKISVVSLT